MPFINCVFTTSRPTKKNTCSVHEQKKEEYTLRIIMSAVDEKLLAVYQKRRRHIVDNFDTKVMIIISIVYRQW